LIDSPVPCDWREPTLGRGLFLGATLSDLCRNSGAIVVKVEEI
jgi:hypothetical protein